jgi:hypothetical protein
MSEPAGEILSGVEGSSKFGGEWGFQLVALNRHLRTEWTAIQFLGPLDFGEAQPTE